LVLEVFDEVVFDLLTLPLTLVVVVELVVVDGEPFVTVVVVVLVVVEAPFALLVVVVVLLTELPELLTLAPPSLGQAAPNKPNVKTAERAITFFISIIFSCLLQRMLLNCLTTILR
jgi:hypothetical protein